MHVESDSVKALEIHYMIAGHSSSHTKRVQKGAMALAAWDDQLFLTT